MQTPQRRRAAHVLLRALEILAWAAFFGFAALFLALRFWLLPQVGRYQDEVVSALSRAVGLQVRIGSLSADWDGLRPRLTVTNLRVLERDGREALVLPVVEHVVGWNTLLARELRLHTLAVEGPRLTVRRDAQGRLHVAGIALSGGQSGGVPGGGVAAWILGQREIVIRNAEIDWLDELRGAPPLELRALQLRLRNRGEVHQIGLSAQPPGALGARLELRGALVGEVTTPPEAWNARVFVELGATDLAGWRPWVDYPFELASGQGALRLWATYGGGRLVDATADLALAAVEARLAGDLQPLRLAGVSGRVHARQSARGYEFGVRRLAVIPAEGPAMKGSTFRASWETTAPARGALSAELIELAPLAQLAEHLPFPADLRKLLAELAPQGRLLEAGLDWTGELPQPAAFRARARFDGLSMKAWRAVPGFANLSGRIEATQDKGTLVLASQNSDIDLPRVFPEPRVRLASLAGEVGWERGARGATVRVAGLAFANEDFAGTAAGTYAAAGDDGPGFLDLSAQVARFDASRLGRYLPLSTLMGEKTRTWLLSSIRGGQATDVRMRLQGNLRDAPFADPMLGQFEVVAQVRNGTLAFAETWPVLEEFAGELRFERNRMEITGRSARSLGLALTGVRAVIPSLRAPAVLTITGDVEGPSAAFLDYVQRSPVQRAIGGVPEGVQAEGRGQLRLRLDLPLSDLAQTRVEGAYRFANNTLRLGARLPPLERASGTLAFTESSLQLREGSGRFLGGPVRVIGGTQRGGGVLLSANGSFTVEGVAPMLGARLSALLKGGAPYAASVRFARGAGPQVAFESSLAGVSVELPPPLGKAAGDALLLHASLVQAADAGRDRISLAYGPLLRAELLRRREDGGMAIERAAIALNPPAGRLRLPERTDSTLVYGTLERLDLDQWLALQGGGGGAQGERNAFELTIGTLDAFGRRMQDVALKASVRDGGWRASVNSPDIAGDVTYEVADGARLVARMARFAVPPESPGAQVARAARDLPALDLAADEFSYRGKRLGRVEIVARHDGPNWRMENLAMRNPEGSLTASGLWRTGPAPGTSLKAVIESADIGRFLDRVGYPGLVRRGSAKMESTLAWNGDPTAIDYPSLSGTIRLHAEGGQFLQVDPGIGKLVSLMSLQQLPRRIALDFRDVFSEGFQWDTIDATATVAQGVLETKDFRMNGGAAAVAMQGKVDLARETQDLRVRVVPGLDGTASTVAWLLVSPVVGLGTLLAQKILKNPLGQIFAYEYGISGSWDDPKVEKVGIVPDAVTAPTGD